MNSLFLKYQAQSTTIAMPYIEAIDSDPSKDKSNLQLAKLAEDYAIKSKIACSIWVEKKDEQSTRMLARFLR